MLTPTEFKQCHKQNYRAILFGKWKYRFGLAAAERWQKATRDNPHITWSLEFKFEWGRARAKLMQEYGFIDLKYEGKKSAITGLSVQSHLTDPTDPTPHVEKIAQIMKDFKKKAHDNCYMDTVGCVVEGSCDRRYKELLAKMLET